MSTVEIRRRVAATANDFATHLHPVLRRVYAARGIGSETQLDLSLDRLAPIGTLENVEAAAELLIAQRSAGRILVVGDFDTDGATSTTLVVRALRAMHFGHVDFLVPDRFRFGYGLTPGIVGLAEARKPTLIVTVDNGISSVEGIEAAHALGVPVLVTDHHLPGATLPRAHVIVNPNLPGSRFASAALAGVGVAFYVMAAVAKRLGDTQFKVADLLDLVALGTVADVVPLDHNNRILVSQGLRRIRAGRCVPGILALLQSAGRDHRQITAADLGFAVAPRLNAAGRLTDMGVGINCLLSDDPLQAARLAGSLSRLNEERRDIEKRMQEEALGLVAALQISDAVESLGLCLFDETWHQGVIGLVAGRIKDRVHRPVIAFARAEDGSLRGSARSVASVNIRDALDSIATRNPGLIDKFGGHAMAAGLSLQEHCLAAFERAFADEIAARVDASTLTGVVYSDGSLLNQEFNLETALALRTAGPWGQGFPEPVFDGEFKVSDLRIVGGKHLKLQLQTDQPGAAALDAIAFGHVGGVSDDQRLRGGAYVHLAFRLEINEYRGNERVQLNCQHLKVCTSAGSA